MPEDKRNLVDEPEEDGVISTSIHGNNIPADFIAREGNVEVNRIQFNRALNDEMEQMQVDEPRAASNARCSKLMAILLGILYVLFSLFAMYEVFFRNQPLHSSRNEPEIKNIPLPTNTSASNVSIIIEPANWNASLEPVETATPKFVYKRRFFANSTFLKGKTEKIDTPIKNETIAKYANQVRPIVKAIMSETKEKVIAAIKNATIEAKEKTKGTAKLEPIETKGETKESIKNEPVETKNIGETIPKSDRKETKYSTETTITNKTKKATGETNPKVTKTVTKRLTSDSTPTQFPKVPAHPLVPLQLKLAPQFETGKPLLRRREDVIQNSPSFSFYAPKQQNFMPYQPR